MSTQRYFATCARGLEPALAGELRCLHAQNIQPGRGGVEFRGDRTLFYQANLWLRTAIRVLLPILDAEVTSPDALYEAVQSIDWQSFMTPDHTLAVDCNVRDSNITHSKYAALRVKDAICDQFVQHCGRRPSVDVEEPMIGLNLHIDQNLAVLSLEGSGESLHKRGYRSMLSKAPLNEALAAGLLLLTEWTGATAFVDPLCGSGTLPTEACWIALRRPPGLTRKRFGFMGWMDYDVGLWTEIRDAARKQVRAQPLAPIVGSDQRRDALGFAMASARAAGVGHLVQFHLKDFADFEPPVGPPGLLLCNPPYGERIGEEKDLRTLYRQMGNVFKQRCQGWRAAVFTGNGRLARSIELDPIRRLHLFNGRIPCQLLEYRP